MLHPFFSSSGTNSYPGTFHLKGLLHPTEPRFGTPGDLGPQEVCSHRAERNSFCAPLCSRTYLSDWPVVSPPGAQIPVLIEREVRRLPPEGAGGRCSARSPMCASLATPGTRWGLNGGTSAVDLKTAFLQGVPGLTRNSFHVLGVNRTGQPFVLPEPSARGSPRAGLLFPPHRGCPFRRACSSLSEEDSPWAAKLSRGDLFMFGRRVWGDGHS